MAVGAYDKNTGKTVAAFAGEIPKNITPELLRRATLIETRFVKVIFSVVIFFWAALFTFDGTNRCKEPAHQKLMKIKTKV
jgi:hypothetical protein